MVPVHRILLVLLLLCARRRAGHGQPGAQSAESPPGVARAAGPGLGPGWGRCRVTHVCSVPLCPQDHQAQLRPTQETLHEHLTSRTKCRDLGEESTITSIYPTVPKTYPRIAWDPFRPTVACAQPDTWSSASQGGLLGVWPVCPLKLLRSCRSLEVAQSQANTGHRRLPAPGFLLGINILKRKQPLTVRF